MEKFRATHEITIETGKVRVMLIDGAAYTLHEWKNLEQADFEQDTDGNWLFQGEPFEGTVRKL
jgi:hypothetical protein